MSTDALADTLLSHRDLPAAIDAEKSILGAVQLDAHLMAQAAADIRPSDFYLAHHRRIFAAMLEIYGTGKSVDLITIPEQLGDQLKGVGGVAYIGSLTEGVPRRPNISQYCRIVKARAQQRSVIHACDAAQGQILSGKVPAEDCIASLQEQLLAIESDTPESPIESADTFADRWYGKLRKRLKGERIPTFTTGIQSLDEMTGGGIREAEMWTIGGRQGDGKSVLGLQCAIANILNGIRVFVVSPEMTKDVLMDRAIAQVSNVPAWKFRQPHTITTTEEEEIAEATMRVKRSPFWVDDSSSISPLQLAARVRLAKAQHGCQLCIVDYLQLILGSGRDRREQVIGISNTLRDLAKTVMPVVALSQLSRPDGKNMNRPPTKHDLMESGSIESDSSTVVLLYRRVDDFNLPTGDDYAIVAKQRHGTLGTLDLAFNRGSLTYRPCTAEESRERQQRLGGGTR